MNKLVLCSLLLIGLSECFKLSVNPLYPQGIRGCVRNIHGLYKFEFSWYVKSNDKKVKSGLEDNEERSEVKLNRGVADESVNGLWCVLDEKTHLRSNDELLYYGIIHFKNGSIEYGKNYTIILQAGDFLDISGIYILPPDPKNPSPCDNGQSNACVFDKFRIKSTTETSNKKINILTVKPIPQIPLVASMQESRSKATVVDTRIETATDQTRSNNNRENPSLFHMHTFNKHSSFGRPTTPSEDLSSKLSTPSPDDTKDSSTVTFISSSTPSIDSFTNSTPHSKTSNSTTQKTSENDNQYSKTTSTTESPLDNIDQNMTKIFTEEYQENLSDLRNSHNPQTCESLLKSAKNSIDSLIINLDETSRHLKNTESDLEKTKSELNKYKFLFRETFKIIAAQTPSVNQSNIMILRFNEPVEDCEVKLHYIIQKQLKVNPKVYDIVKSKPLDNNSIQFELETYTQKILIYLMNLAKKSNRYDFIDVDKLN